MMMMYDDDDDDDNDDGDTADDDDVGVLLIVMSMIVIMTAMNMTIVLIMMRLALMCWGVAGDEDNDTAEYGDYVSGPRVIDPSVKQHMKEVLADIQSGAFAKRFIEDQDKGAPEFKALRAKGEAHPIEATGRELRKMFSWIKSSNKDDYQEGKAAR